MSEKRFKTIEDIHEYLLSISLVTDEHKEVPVDLPHYLLHRCRRTGIKVHTSELDTKCELSGELDKSITEGYHVSYLKDDDYSLYGWFDFRLCYIIRDGKIIETHVLVHKLEKPDVWQGNAIQLCE